MDPSIKIIVTIIIPIMIILSIAYGAAHFTKESTFDSEYEYEVVINPDRDISNLSLEVPFPSEMSKGTFSNPRGWTIGVYEDNNILLIEADYIYSDTNSSVSLSIRTDEEIDTREPLEEEFILDPEANFTETECEDSEIDPEKCYTYNYTGGLEITYDSDEDPDIEVYIELSGRNRWWMLGDMENQYSDCLLLIVKGPNEYSAEGELKTGIGDY